LQGPYWVCAPSTRMRWWNFLGSVKKRIFSWIQSMRP
jgi:hypothetical protein